jgi:hypothetical protein
MEAGEMRSQSGPRGAFEALPEDESRNPRR